MFCQLDKLYRDPTEGLADDIRENLRTLFMARWKYFHTPVFTAAYAMEPEYIQVKLTADEEQLQGFQDVLEAMAIHVGSEDHNCNHMLADWAALQTAIRTDTKGMADDGAFSECDRKIPSFEWGHTYLYLNCASLAMGTCTDAPDGTCMRMLSFSMTS